MLLCTSIVVCNNMNKRFYKLLTILILGAQLSSRCFFDENVTLLWKNGYKWIIQNIAHR